MIRKNKYLLYVLYKTHVEILLRGFYAYLIPYEYLLIYLLLQK